MNVNSGGPHLLLFERDSQLTALLSSEFQLAGYACHPARTAVEVFDAIARYSVRLVLVDLAQAAASRREFWVALDAQRRGRGVQVLTFRCINLAGYGAADPDERTPGVMPDIEVDGMLGIVSLVDAVRSRLPLSTTGSFSRVVASPVRLDRSPDTINGRMGASSDLKPPDAIHRVPPAGAVEPAASSIATTETTAPMPRLTNNSTLSSLAAPSPPGKDPIHSVRQNLIDRVPAAPSSAPAISPPDVGNGVSTFTDTIHAVIGSNDRTFSPDHQSPPVGTRLIASEGTSFMAAGESQHLAQQPIAPQQEDPQVGQRIQSPPTGRASSQPHVAPPIASAPQAAQDESGLAQLSRMVEEHAAPMDGLQAEDTMNRDVIHRTPTDAIDRVPTQEAPSIAAPENDQQGEQISQSHSASLQELPLRASPIQDIPLEHAAPRAGTRLIASEGTSFMASLSSLEMAAQASAPLNELSPTLELSIVELEAQKGATPQSEAPTTTQAHPAAQAASALQAPSPEIKAEGERAIDRTRISSVPSPQVRVQETKQDVTSDETLLNIMQSLPPIPSPQSSPTLRPPQSSAVLNGRATRALGSVLLEGHLVPQNRLEVAQHIQRMLRGVDMNYQLGEILLMFKLLTPDQLLAASLVSYGLITTQQISALGRIRQELHVIGLEYDLESLLVLFRILSPEQLREVRASWSG